MRIGCQYGALQSDFAWSIPIIVSPIYCFVPSRHKLVNIPLAEGSQLGHIETAFAKIRLEYIRPTAQKHWSCGISGSNVYLGCETSGYNRIEHLIKLFADMKFNTALHSREPFEHFSTSGEEISFFGLLYCILLKASESQQHKRYH